MKEQDIFYVYYWIRPDTNEIFYIGKGSGNRITSLKSRNLHVLNVVKKFRGLKNIIKGKFVDNISEEESFNLEIEKIKEYREKLGNRLLNISDGGDGSAGWFEHISYEEQERHREISKSWTGKKHTPEQLKKISEARIGKKIPEDTRKKISETRKKLFAEKKIMAYWAGKKLSDDTRKKISETRKKLFAEGKISKEHYKNYSLIFTPEYMKKISDIAKSKREIIKYCIFDENYNLLYTVTAQDEVYNKTGIAARTVREYLKIFKETGKITFHKKLKISVLKEKDFNNLKIQSTIENISEDNSEKK